MYLLLEKLPYPYPLPLLFIRAGLRALNFWEPKHTGKAHSLTGAISLSTNNTSPRGGGLSWQVQLEERGPESAL